MNRKQGPGIALAVLLAAGMLACGGSGEQPEVAQEPAPHESEVRMAEAMYEEQICSMCHGENAEGAAGGPALQQLAPYWTVERLAEYLEDPEAFRAANPDFEERRDVEYDLEMPAFDDLSLAERRLLARWLMSR